MKNILKEIRGKMRQDNRGLSLVEILCAIAIFSLVTVTIGSVIVISARTYNKGITETSLQQEAQLAANRISTIIQDASEATFTGGTLTLKTNADKEYTIRHVGDKLLYTDSDVTDATLAEKIKLFNVHNLGGAFEEDEFKKSRTLYLDMRVESGSKAYNVNYAIAARNEMTVDIASGPAEIGASIFCDGSVILVPGETYKVPLTIAGKVDLGLEADITGDGVTVDSVEMDGVTLTADTTIAADHVNLEIRTKDTYGDGSPKAKADITVNIRRVKDIKVTYVVDRRGVDASKTSYSYEAEGAVYTFYANSTIDNPDRMFDAPCDSNYKNPRQVVWTEELTINDVPAEVGDYFEVEYKDEAKENLPKAVYKVKQDWPAGLKMTIKATSKHGHGENKAASDYADVFGEAVIEARGTKIASDIDVIIEPLDTFGVVLDSKGGRPQESDVSFEYYEPDGVTTYNPESDTVVKYDPATDKVNIKLGKGEKGSGTTGTEPYTFMIKVKVKGGVNESMIKVHVRRVDYVHIDAIRNPDDATTMDLRLRFNADVKDDNLIQYLINGTDKDKSGQPFAYNALSTRVTIEVLDKNNNPNNDLTQIAEWGTYESVNRDKSKESGIIDFKKGKWDKELKSKDGKKTIYKIENTKPARISYDGSAWRLEQTPELDIKPMSLNVGEKIRVTMESLHPTGRNNAEDTYKTDVKDIYILEGQKIISVAKEDEGIIVEPYQVADTGNGSMVIPVYLAPSVKAIKVKLEGQDTNTRVLVDGKPSNRSDGIAEIVKPDDKSDVINLNLNISRTEEGKEFEGKTGRIRMTLMAYSELDMTKDANLLDSIIVYLGVRRVTEVEIADKDKFANEAGTPIELRALATGFEGTEYFDRQVKKSDEKYEPVWDSVEKYKSPYKLKWSLYYKDSSGKENEREITNDYSEYFSNVSTDSQDGKGNGAQIIRFTLTKALPNGAQIRATSVHAGNKEGKAENRSGLNYIRDIDKYRSEYPEGIVFDYIEIAGGGRIDITKDCGFERYNEQNFTLPGYESIPNYMSSSNHYSGQNTFYRYRPVGGTWSQYYVVDSNTPNTAYITGGKMGTLFRTDTEYELDCVFVVYNTNEKKIYWPLNDETLLQPGMGFAEAGYSLAQWDYGTLTDVQKNFQCRQEYYIAKTELFIEPYPNPARNQYDIRKTIPERAQSAGTETNPVKADSWSQGNSQQWFSVNMAPYAFCLHAQQGKFNVIIEKKTGNGWEYVEESSMQDTQKWKVTARNPEITIGYAYGAKGMYRLRAYIDGIKWSKPTGNIFYPVYDFTDGEQMKLYDEDGRGTIYAEFEIQTTPPPWAQ